MVITATASSSNNRSQQGTHSIAELITDFHKTIGDIPPPLIGATATLAGQHIYVFGGRLQSTRQLSNKVYILDLETKAWRHLQPQNKPPAPRYFHSANQYEVYTTTA
ncbi:hypothetical protein BDF20DRAFT_985156, partial [Mycotypha africana]|uniref:uncharacterized protein n=1 Tax=Mycotypha africana TaxID=64632 RepID=UPI0022FFD703